MLKSIRPDIVLAFPANSSKGTWDMVKRANDADIDVVVHVLRE
jgi:hypothetical protein